MSFRLRKSMKLFPGAKINIGKTGIGMSTGIKGAHQGLNKRGTYTDIGIPGTGISTFQYIGKGKTQTVQPAPPKKNHLFLKILFFPLWLEFLVASWLLQLIFKAVWYVTVTLITRPSVSDTKKSSLSAPVSPDQAQHTNNLSPQEQALKICTGQFMAKEKPEELEEHYKQMMKYCLRNYHDYILSGVVKGKYWALGKNDDPNVCEVCRENARAGILPLKAPFPSGHLHPPAGPLCRCDLQPDIEE